MAEPPPESAAEPWHQGLDPLSPGTTYDVPLNSPRAAPAPDAARAPAPRWHGAAFALTTLAVGFAGPAVVFAREPAAARRLGLSAVPIPAWVFVAVWLVAYPGMGLAAWFALREPACGDRAARDVGVPLAVLAAAFVVTMSFWLTDSLRMTATLDAINLLLAWTTAWIFSRYSTRAVLCLIPWALWMPVTLAFKLVALSRGLT